MMCKEVIESCIKANLEYLEDNPKTLIEGFIKGKITAYKRVLEDSRL